MKYIQRITTDDGSASAYSNHYEQAYHNPGGAYSESVHNFIETPRLDEIISAKQNISIFETGFGTGLNLLLVLDLFLKNDRAEQLHYQTVEAYPVKEDLFRSFNYEQFVSDDSLIDQVAAIFAGLKEGQNQFSLYHNVSVSVFKGYFRDMKKPKAQVDVIFHDPFSPRVNPELWTPESFSTLYKISSNDALMTTYCAASKARAAMAVAGWFVASAPGALGKREMTVASKNRDNLNDLKRVNEERLVNRFQNGDFE